MGFLKRFAAGAAAGAAAVFYTKAMRARNRKLERPPILDRDGRPMPVGTFRYSDGETVEYIDRGEGLPIVWVPGADGPKETFRYQLPWFARRHRVISADLRERFGPDDGFARFVDDLAELLDALGVDAAVFVGQSLGAAITLAFAETYPDRVLGVVLANPVARVTYEHVGLNRTALIPLAQATTRYLPTPLSVALARHVWSPLNVWVFDDSTGSEALVRYTHDTGPRTTPGRVSAARVARLRGVDLLSDLWKIDVPAIVVKGPQDVYCPVSWALEIVDRLPRAEFVTIPGTGHCSHISRPEVFNRVVESWLERSFPEASAHPESEGEMA